MGDVEAIIRDNIADLYAAVSDLESRFAPDKRLGASFAITEILKGTGLTPEQLVYERDLWREGGIMDDLERKKELYCCCCHEVSIFSNLDPGDHTLGLDLKCIRCSISEQRNAELQQN